MKHWICRAYMNSVHVFHILLICLFVCSSCRLKKNGFLNSSQECISMDESDLFALRRANHLSRQRGDPRGSFDVLVAYDSDIQQQESPGDRSTRSEETLRELAGLSRIDSASPGFTRQDYEEVAVQQEIPVRDIDTETAVLVQTQPQFDLFSAASLPSSPDRLTSPVRPSAPQVLNSSDPLVDGDRNTARYLRILVPQQDTGSLALPPDIHRSNPAYSRNTSLNFSEGDFFGSQPSTAEILLLESPSDSPAHFSQLRLTLNSLESDGETFLSLDESIGEQQHSLNSSFLRQPSRQHSRQQKVTNKSKVSEETQGLGSDLEKELRRLVVEIYSEKKTEFVRIPGLLSNRMEAIHPGRSTAHQGNDWFDFTLTPA